MENFNIKSTVINDFVRVSSAGIVYEGEEWGNRIQYETWIFSDNRLLQKSVQVIHGSCSVPSYRLREMAGKVHSTMVKGLMKKFDQQKEATNDN